MRCPKFIAFEVAMFDAKMFEVEVWSSLGVALGRLWDRLASFLLFWGSFSATWRGLGGVLGRSWVALGRLEAVLGAVDATKGRVIPPMLVKLAVFNRLGTPRWPQDGPKTEP